MLCLFIYFILHQRAPWHKNPKNAHHHPLLFQTNQCHQVARRWSNPASRRCRAWLSTRPGQCSLLWPWSMGLFPIFLMLSLHFLPQTRLNPLNYSPSLWKQAKQTITGLERLTETSSEFHHSAAPFLHLYCSSAFLSLNILIPHTFSLLVCLYKQNGKFKFWRNFFYAFWALSGKYPTKKLPKIWYFLKHLIYIYLFIYI